MGKCSPALLTQSISETVADSAGCLQALLDFVIHPAEVLLLAVQSGPPLLQSDLGGPPSAHTSRSTTMNTTTHRQPRLGPGNTVSKFPEKKYG